MLEAVDARVRARHQLGPIEMSRERAIEDLGDQRRLARARDAGDRDEHAERDVDGEVAEIVRPGAHDRAVAGRPSPFAARSAPGPAARRAGSAPVSECGMREDVRHGAFGHDLPAVAPRAGTQVDDVIGGADRVLVVLHHEHRVAEVAQLPQGREQPLVVALVQPDARLVEDVEHADQPRTDLGGQADPLGLAAGEGPGGAAERQVLEPDIAQEAEPPGDFLDDRAGDLGIDPARDRRAERDALEDSASASSTGSARRPRRCSAPPPAPTGSPA